MASTTLSELQEIGETGKNFQHHSTIYYLQAKTTYLHNVIVGSEPVQIRFMEQQMGLTAQRAERLSDDMLLGKPKMLFIVSASHQIDLSPEVKKKVGIWSAAEIKKGSSAISTLVEVANTLAPSPTKGLKLKREVINAIGDQLVKTPVCDIRVALWRAVTILGYPQVPFIPWPEPWDAPTTWLPPGLDPGLRLHTLYKQLVSYALVRTRGTEAVRAFGITPSKQNWLRRLSLDNVRVYRSLFVLARWRRHQTPAFICALKISAIWS
jgi:hypothetical protein